MGQIERINHMERQLEVATQAVKGLAVALEEYEAAQGALRELGAYYGSAEWKQDFADDEAGLLPKDVKRGVLSEDAIWNLLEMTKGIRRKMDDAGWKTERAPGADNEPQVQTTELLRTSQSWDGAELPDYPQGRPVLVARKYVFPAGQRLDMHYHPVINFGVLIEGELTIICEDGSEKTVHEGEAIVEMVGTVHYGENRGTKPAILYMFYLSQEGLPLSVQQ